ncbi:hypothetical protein MMC25_002316 [Agyrium rufum]|nr:hypothetical protein [Agyrium rufum]
MSRSRIVQLAGLAVVGGGGYYLYTAGGSPKVASKEIQHDAAAASAKVRGTLPGSGKEAQKQGEEWAAKAGQQIDSTVADARAKSREADVKIGKAVSDGEAKLGQLRNEGEAKLHQLSKETKQNIDKFDATVERKTSEAKSGISSWFGFGK